MRIKTTPFIYEGDFKTTGGRRAAFDDLNSRHSR
jgi:hypothetical protein